MAMKLIHPGMKACLTDGATATVTDVLLDPHDGAERFVVLSANGYFGPDVVAPFSTVWRVDDYVHVSLSSHELTTLPHFAPVTYCQEAGLTSRAAMHHGAGWRHHNTGSAPR